MHVTNIHQQFENYLTYTDSAEAYTTNQPGLGLLPAKIARDKLCKNYCDIESQLFGIGSTNLVTPKQPISPVLIQSKQLDVIDGIPLQIPKPLIIEKNQRPYMN